MKNWKKGFTKIGFEICDSAKLKIAVSLLFSKSFGLLRRYVFCNLEYGGRIFTGIGFGDVISKALASRVRVPSISEVDPIFLT